MCVIVPENIVFLSHAWFQMKLCMRLHWISVCLSLTCAGFTPVAVWVCAATLWENFPSEIIWYCVFKLCSSAVSVCRWACLWPSGWQQSFGSSSRCMCPNGTWAGPRLGSLISQANTVTSSLFLSHSFWRF